MGEEEFRCRYHFSTLLPHFKKNSVGDTISRHSFHTLNAPADKRIKTFCQTKRLIEAMYTFKHMLSTKSNPTLSTYNLLSSILVQRNRHQSALSIYNHMVEADILPDLITLNIVINCHCEIGRMDYAFQVFEGMEAHGYIPSVIAFNTLIKGIWNRLSTSCRLEQTCEHGISLARRDG
jgi:pentatricopeptide repeat protein